MFCFGPSLSIFGISHANKNNVSGTSKDIQMTLFTFIRHQMHKIYKTSEYLSVLGTYVKYIWYLSQLYLENDFEHCTIVTSYHLTGFQQEKKLTTTTPSLTSPIAGLICFNSFRLKNRNWKVCSDQNFSRVFCVHSHSQWPGRGSFL